jgi:hypothetical protein
MSCLMIQMCVITVDNVLHCIMKCICSPNHVKATRLRRMGLAGFVACMGCITNDILGRPEKADGREDSIPIIHISV